VAENILKNPLSRQGQNIGRKKNVMKNPSSRQGQNIVRKISAIEFLLSR
tara:strand:- start:201 stop:347 length:147 start_codon:yes stop_codon:yes gene_type:complete